ncbi:MAG: S9 family peptidase [Lewinellaceae bacterium]|nr:S9 family peptidase [Phaeodactylibacter sp.]MCB9036673.1 S9 family peptidase [Lewinellaceae bacterium]
MSQRIFFTLLHLIFFSLLSAQGQKKALAQEDIAAWKQIEGPRLSPNGRWVSYVLKPNEGEPALLLYDTQQKKETVFERASNARLSADNLFLTFLIHPHEDTLKAQRRRKVEEEDLPKDTLAIYNLEDGQLRKIPRVKAFTLPEKWGGWLAYHTAPMPADTTLPDSVKVKKENEENGSLLVLHNLENGKEDSIPYAHSYIAAEEAPRFLIYSTGNDSTFEAGTYLFDGAASRLFPLAAGDGTYAGLALDKKGRQAAFLAYQDTLQPQAVPYTLHFWQDGQAASRPVADSSFAFLPAGWMLSEHGKIEFSEDGGKLYFGIAPPPVLQDTTLLEEEIVNVEVWTYQDARLYTQEEEELEEEQKRSYACVFHRDDDKIVVLGNKELPEVQTGDEGNANIALAYNPFPYYQEVSWEGFPACKDVYLVDLHAGKRSLVARKVCGDPALSPEARYVYWYSHPDSAWYAYSVEKRQARRLAPEVKVAFYDELNDRPMHPSPYGIAGWTTGDDFIMIYDRFDVWLVDPSGQLASNNLTSGRQNGKRYRYIQLDPEERAIEEVKPMLFHTFDEKTKASGYAWFNIHTGVLEQIQEGPYAYESKVQKAREADAYLFTRESFQVFPDLLYSNNHFRSFEKVSNANPQQSGFRWGSVELFRWTGAQGQEMEGLLIKPEGFDPARKYPAITYFYERYAEDLHRHWTPRFPRSFINFPYYASRGYVIFIPDIHYRVGYPGESALEAVTTGLGALLDEGFIDRDRIGVQGHSWGGYQSAYLITRTNLFRCAESGAPVVNMTSAYGGIRWGSGLSRMFQYERTQSRIGATLWEKPLRYIENSPLFYADRIETPVLILHNDDDGAVPWYQGIEFFVALRRLGKPAWLLNYNGEPHGIAKDQNKKDFQRRMQQFFDYYLLDAPMPAWMKSGVPPLEKGIRQGFEAGE